ncbi:MAG: hypothetical protein B7X53_16660, partial [Hyphomonas sp. 34-62-18]
MKIHQAAPGHDELYVSHNYFQDGQACSRLSRIGLAIAEDRVVAKGKWQTLYETQPCVDLADRQNVFYGPQSGGAFLFQEDGSILKSAGDFGFGLWTPEKFENGALGDWSSLLLINAETGEKQVVATGFRNPQGLAFDEYGQLWATDQGPRGGDELNQIEWGGNYGWPTESYGMGYGVGTLPRSDLPLNEVQGQHVLHSDPIHAFLPSIGLSTIAFLPTNTETFPLWAGDALLGSLSGNSMLRVRMRDNRVVYSERIPLGHRLREIIKLEDGQLAVWTDSRSIILIRDPDVQGEGEELRISGYQPIHEIEAGLAAARDTSWRREVFQLHCGQCHTVNGEPGIGPSLHSIEGRKIGADEYYPYSTA